MNQMPQWIWIIAGISGSGKSTITGNDRFSEKLPDMPVLNVNDVQNVLHTQFPDLTKEKSYEQAVEMVSMDAHMFIDAEQPFCIKTALRSDRFKKVAEKARAKNIRIGMIYVGLSSLELAHKRLQNRVTAGDSTLQTVTLDDLKADWQSSLNNLSWFAPRVDRLLIYNNDDPNGRPALIAEGKDGKVQILNTLSIPDITDILLPISGM
ncbi:MAG: hypothetical protein CMF31_04775 [Kordiimonas sp.]|nr:hypothetical protein [Kordiimonas sp.]